MMNRIARTPIFRVTFPRLASRTDRSIRSHARTVDDLAQKLTFSTTTSRPKNAKIVTATLERRGLIRPVGGNAYDFTHDLVRQTVYRALSQPWRKLLHRRIACALDAVIGRDGAFAADIAHHAALAEDDDLAAHACRLAGERALRLFANAEAASFAERGLRHAERPAEAQPAGAPYRHA